MASVEDSGRSGTFVEIGEKVRLASLWSMSA
jgi:hypothetical protein